MIATAELLPENEAATVAYQFFNHQAEFLESRDFPATAVDSGLIGAAVQRHLEHEGAEATAQVLLSLLQQICDQETGRAEPERH